MRGHKNRGEPRGPEAQLARGSDSLGPVDRLHSWDRVAEIWLARLGITNSSRVETMQDKDANTCGHKACQEPMGSSPDASETMASTTRA